MKSISDTLRLVNFEALKLNGDVKIRVCQINSTVGDFDSNSAKVSQVLSASDVDLFVFPECALCGYPPQDLLDYPAFAERCEAAVERLAQHFKSKTFIIGGVERNRESGRPLRNTAYFVSEGKIQARYFKRLLPTYDVFDEDRFFEPGRSSLTLTIGGRQVFLTICEDIWNDEASAQLHNRYDQFPLEETQGIDLLVNISASPFESQKVLGKQRMLSNIAKRHQIPLLYVNAVGANDSIIFDGRSFLYSSRGEMLYEGPAFSESQDLIDLTSVKPQAPRPVHSIQDLYDALVLGIRDYCQKQGFTSALVGMSGGIDSSLVVCLAEDALGAENVVGVLMPSRFTSRESNEDAVALARVLQNPIHLLPIEHIFSSSLLTLSKAFEGTAPSVAEENIQSRIRGLLLMAMSNKFGHLLLTTGNKSELATGYCTLYGDMNGGLAPLSDVYKTEVYELSREANRRKQRIPERVFSKAPTAELKLNQTDQDTLPPYEQLDKMLRLILEEFKTRSDLVASGFSEPEVTQVLKWIECNEYKRYQMPLGLKVSSKAFGIGRRMPIVHKFFSHQ